MPRGLVGQAFKTTVFVGAAFVATAVANGGDGTVRPYYSPVTIDHTKVAADVTGFPARITIRDSRLKYVGYTGGHVQSRYGYDIHWFTTSGLSVAMPYRLISYDGVVGEAVFDVTGPYSSSVNDVLYVRYGDPGQTADGSSTSVYDASFKAVPKLLDSKVASIRRGTQAVPIINYNQASWNSMQVQEPCPFRSVADPSKIVMLMAGMDGALPAVGEMRIGRFTASVTDPAGTWTPDAGNPVLSRAALGGTWAASATGIRLNDTLLVGTRRYISITGHDAGGVDSIGLAYTDDEGVTFTECAHNPVLEGNGQGRNDGTHASQGTLTLIGSTVYMVYSTRGGAGGTLPNLRVATCPVANLEAAAPFAKVLAGDVWTKSASPGFDSQYIEWHTCEVDDTYLYVTCEVFCRNGGSDDTTGTWRCLSGRVLLSALGGAWTFTKATYPVLGPSGVVGRGDVLHVATPRFFQAGDFWCLFFQGGNTRSYNAANWPMYVRGMPYGWTLADMFAAATGAADATANANDFAAGNGLTKAGLLIPTTGTLRARVRFRLVPGANNNVIGQTYHATGPQLFSFQPYTDGASATHNVYGGWYKPVANDDRAIWASTGLLLGVWYDARLEWTNGSTVRISFDDASKATVATLDATWDTTGDTFSIKYDEGAAVLAQIDVEDLALESVVRATGWKTTMYNCLGSPDTFCSLGTEVQT